MNDLNTLALIGRVTRDAELRYTASGTALSSFAIAVNRSVKKGDQWTDEASFIDLTVWGKTAENLNKYLVKGTQVAVQGSLEQQRWEKDGQKFSKLAVHVDSVQLIGGKRESSGSTAQPQSSPPPTREEGFDPHDYPDDIPF